jgi:hypothetical protein
MEKITGEWRLTSCGEHVLKRPKRKIELYRDEEYPEMSLFSPRKCINVLSGSGGTRLATTQYRKNDVHVLH